MFYGKNVMYVVCMQKTFSSTFHATNIFFHTSGATEINDCLITKFIKKNPNSNHLCETKARSF